MKVCTLILSFFVLSMAEARKQWIDAIANVVEDITDEIPLDDIADVLDDVAHITRDMADNSGVFFDYMDHMFGNGLPVKNVTCVKRYCTDEITNCLADGTCRSDLGCAAGCWEDSMCTFNCSQTYTTPVYDAMMSCLLVDHQCVSLPPPDAYNNATCRDPTDSAIPIGDDTLTGDWYIIQGYNPTYDCFECAKQSLATKGNEVDYSALFNMINKLGDEIWVSSAYAGKRNDDGKTVYLGTTDFGLTDDQTWYVMHRDDDTLVVYYCGAVLTWHFEGLLVMSTTTALNPAKAATVESIVTGLGFTED